MSLPRDPDKTCTVDGCGRPLHARSWCRAHYERWRIHGDAQVDAPVAERGLSRAQRMEKYIDRSGGECWQWTGYINPNGYGHFDGRGAIHREVYENHVGPIPDDLVLDHLCRIRHCVNPAHLEPVTFIENVQRGVEARLGGRSHCVRGHELTPENLQRRSDRDGVKCRLCVQETNRAYRKRKKAQEARS